MTTPSTRIELFADILCPFTHVGLRRFVDHRAGAGRTDVGLWVRAWPLEVVNGQPLDAGFIAEEIDEIREQVAPDLFTAFDRGAFPSSSLPALALARALAAGIRDGTVDVDDPRLRDHLRRTTRADLAIANPKWLDEAPSG